MLLFILVKQGSPCDGMSCGWDNDGGWTCDGNYDCSLNKSTGVDSCSNTCRMQWPAPWLGSADKNPLLSSSTSSLSTFPLTSGLSSFNVTSNLPPSDNIPLIIGTTIGGTTLVGSSGLVYYLWRKRKKPKSADQSTTTTTADLNNLQLVNQEETIELTEFEDNSHLVAQIQQANY